MTRILVAAAALLLACRGAEPPAPAPAPPERPTQTVTAYADGLELFLEFPSLVQGLDSPFITHFTDARDPQGFHAITEGSATATLRYADGAEESFVAKAPLRAGVFKPVVRPTRAGKATLTLRLEGAQASGTVPAGDVTVFPDEPAAIAAEPAEEPSAERAVPYLKETQWRTEYATVAAEVRELQASVAATAEIKPVAGRAAEVAAPVGGRLVLTGPVPFVGQRVRKGTLFGSVAPVLGAAGPGRALLDLEASRARTELDLAERDLRRAEELAAKGAVPEKRVEEARARRELAEAQVSSTRRQLDQLARSESGAGGGANFQLRAPIDGVVAFAAMLPGAVVEPGARLVSIVNTDRVWLEARVFEADIAAVEHGTGAAFTVEGFDREFVVDAKSGRKIAVGSVVDPATRTVPVVFELANPRGALKPGMFAKARLFTGRQVRALSVPVEAVVDSDGLPVVFVLEGGESFFKRRVRLGVRSGGWVEVREGVRPGERVVSRGAYEIALSTASGGIPEHGHQH